MELSGAEASRPYIEAAKPEHPSLLDPHHLLDELLGVVNIPNVTWIDEHGIIVRPPEPGWPGPTELPAEFAQRLAERAKQQAEAAAAGKKVPNLMAILRAGQNRETYADAIRDWARHGADSAYAMTPDEVIAASHPRTEGVSEAAARFELANELWRRGERDAAIEQFRICHRLQPENWTYKRQAWSLVGSERGGGPYSRFNQVPEPGKEADWPFDGDFDRDVAALEPGEYYPRTL
jgi:hypothetical protein